MNCLVTGGAGFIGSHLCEVLLEKGHNVTVIDDLSIGSTENLKEFLENGLIKFVQGDILEESLLDDLISKSDIVFHLAAVVGVKHVVDNPVRGIYVNYGGTEKVLRLCHLHKKRVVFTSSSEVYGKSKMIPFSEEGDMVLGPSYVPRWSYAVSKALGEHLAIGLSKKGLAATVVRYFNAYGPKSKPDGYGSVVAKFTVQAINNLPITVFGDGSQIRAFSYVKDIARGTMLAGMSENSVGKIYNIGGNNKIKIFDLAEKIRDMVSSSSPIKLIPPDEEYGKNFEDIDLRCADMRKAREELNFECKISLEEGLQKTIEWFRAVPLKKLA
ncbi:MAG: NAD-dependent epimerase/dehydratase family protein [Candidatus Schekmanbacteria bacterium]|nr:MAG: NAD-dependent epimerase/dehydratase family protein [Candidatus Schekmanbacteria bacterium]